MRKLVCNIIQCNRCKEVLHSKYRHDFVRCTCQKYAFTDGGIDYMRRGGAYTDMSIFIDDDFNKIRENFQRWNSRDNTYYYLKNISTEWLESIIEFYLPPDNMSDMDPDFLALYLKEKLWRAEKEYPESSVEHSQTSG